eukprot:2884307-Rhodomonas_salina.2
MAAYYEVDETNECALLQVQTHTERLLLCPRPQALNFETRKLKTTWNQRLTLGVRQLVREAVLCPLPWMYQVRALPSYDFYLYRPMSDMRTFLCSCYASLPTRLQRVPCYGCCAYLGMCLLPARY